MPTKLLPGTSQDMSTISVQHTFLKLAEWQQKLKVLNGSELQEFALNLYFASPHTYKLLKALFQFPKIGTLHRLYVKIPLKLDQSVMNSLFLKIKHLPNQAKYCTMCIGDMKLKPHLYYDTKEDDLVGFHFIDGKVTNKLATRAYVVMLQGIFHKWRQPFLYAFLPDTEHYEALGPWVDNLIKALLTIGIEVKALVSDQNSNFDKFAKDIKGVTIENPYFFVEERKIFYIFNVPTLLCSVRDGLVACDFEFDENTISWNDIKSLYTMESENGFKLIPKITAAHIDPGNFSLHKPRVELAAQVFSRTVSVAMDTHINFNTLPKEAKGTANFIQSMDNIFDVLNSSNVISNKACQLAYTNADEQRTVLIEALILFSKIKPKAMATCRNGVPITETFHNFQISIQAVLQLHQDFTDLLFEKVFTRRLNKDHLEVLFDSILWHEDTCAAPTPVKFSRAFSKQYMINMLQNTPCDCANLLPNACHVLSEVDEVTEYKTVTPSSVLLNPVSANDYQLDLPEANALTYISSYLLYKCYEQHKCDDLIQVMKNASLIGSGNLAYCKDLNSEAPFHAELKTPPAEFVAYVERLETAFIQNKEYLVSGRPGSAIFEALKTTVTPRLLCPCFPAEYCIKLFVRLRIYIILKFTKMNIKSGNNIPIIMVEHL